MFNNIIYSICCTALLCEIVMFDGVSAMKRRNSFSGVEHKRDEALTRPRSDSLPVTKEEIAKALKAIKQWSHLVPKDSVTKQINAALLDAIELPIHRQKREVLVALICKPEHRGTYANYAHMVFASVFSNCDNAECAEFSGMLATIAGSKGGDPSLFWNWYASGYFNSHPPLVVEECCD